MQKLLQLAVAKTVIMSVQLKWKTHTITTGCLLLFLSILQVKINTCQDLQSHFLNSYQNSVTKLCTTLTLTSATDLTPQGLQGGNPSSITIPFLCQPLELQVPCFYKRQPTFQLGASKPPETSQDQEPQVTDILCQPLFPSPLVLLTCCSTPSCCTSSKEVTPHASSPGNFYYVRCIYQSKHELLLPFLPLLPPFCYYPLVLLFLATAGYFHNTKVPFFPSMVVYIDKFDVFLKPVQDVKLILTSPRSYACLQFNSSFCSKPSFMRAFNLSFSGFYY